MRRSNLDDLRNLQGIRDQMTAIACWRVMGVDVNRDDARRLFDRFRLTIETRETIDRFCDIVVIPWSDEVAREIDELINRVLALVILLRSHALADFDTTLREIYSGTPKEDVNALF